MSIIQGKIIKGSRSNIERGNVPILRRRVQGMRKSGVKPCLRNAELIIRKYFVIGNFAETRI